MNRDSLSAAVTEAKRFLAAAQLAKARMADEKYWGPSKETGALRRASLDLTRALAELRRPS